MKKLLSIIVAFVLSITALAQVSIKVQAPNLVGLEEQFNVTFIISGENAPSEFSWNEGSDFQLVWGPQKGSTSSMSIINGHRSRSSQTTYTYVLIPKSSGKFQLPAAVALVKGERLTSSRPTIEVVAEASSSSSAAQPNSHSESDQGEASVTSVDDDDIFLKLTFNKKNVMVGETVTATLMIYQRVNIAGFENAKFPTFNGFWSQEVQAPTNIEFHRENVENKIYNAAVIRKWNLVPQQAGAIQVEGAELVCLVNVRAPRVSTGSIFDSFFQDDFQTIRKRISTKPVTVNVNKLPSGAPTSFGGGVGSFKMSAALTRDSLKTHDAASLKITVTGSGNVSLLEAPKLAFPPDFEVYDIKSTDISGGKVFEYPFIPRSAGDFVIGPVEYSYFDIATRKYVSLSCQPLSLKVIRGNESADGNGQLVQGVARKSVNDIGSDIRYIVTEVPLFSSIYGFFFNSSAFWAIIIALILCTIALYAFLRITASRRADVVGTKNRAATKMARKRLALAGDFLKKDLYSAFYEELHKALSGYVSDKLNMQIADMSKENILSRLQQNGISQASAEEFIGLLDACEYARYSPDSGQAAMNAHYETAVSVISTIDDNMKRRHKPSAGVAALILAFAMLVPLNSANAANQNQEYADSLWKDGVKAYAEGQWTDAVKSWEQIRSLNIISPQLYYNLGNAYFKDGDYAHSILNYERALKLDPSYSDARVNLEFAQNMTQDKIGSVPEFFLKTWCLKLSRVMPSDDWAVLMIVFFAITLAMLLVFLLGRTVAARKTGFIAGIASLLLTISCLAFSSLLRSDYLNADSAIVTKTVTSVKSSPGSGSPKDLFILHEGTKLKLLDEVGEWRNIEIADGRQGWILSSDIEVI